MDAYCFRIVAFFISHTIADFRFSWLSHLSSDIQKLFLCYSEYYPLDCLKFSSCVLRLRINSSFFFIYNSWSWKKKQKYFITVESRWPIDIAMSFGDNLLGFNRNETIRNLGGGGRSQNFTCMIFLGVNMWKLWKNTQFFPYLAHGIFSTRKIIK